MPKVNLSIARRRRANSLHSWLARRQAAESVRAAALLLIRASDQPEETSLQLDPSQRVRTVVEDDIVERKRQSALGPSLRFAAYDHMTHGLRIVQVAKQDTRLEIIDRPELETLLPKLEQRP